ncbi:MULTISPECIES: class I SAM-dependent methyltransferase [unclassified Pseudomonas]|uniref:class I SAM-dependent methyltransferase n=1 Tax=unclassified Pseudomonas TaxID=196821 RepID=UPI002AC97996|nr:MULTISPECIES: class I SAM-dependent methyltransferase [unclassified Pseudomonas]MEB0046580.1 class I SAM-dependent methyltransferase [Pseudomonas sp. Dout3]MEB0095346.1 class I SAM-dependent methyltransferase [Pseudomonas sp. DC1.2]WPX60931.1 class I SAM-dependent methyltransferase [Pseudomonas sp. DC1.2]
MNTQFEAGELNRHLEPLGPGLHHLFVLRVNGSDWVGRKILQQDHCGGRYISSLLKPWMLLGPLTQLHWSNEGVAVYFRQVTLQDKETTFNIAQAQPDSEICFPFPVVDDAGLEEVCPLQYWHCDESLAKQLDADETHLRQYCATLLKTMASPGAVIHDPACSTGEFIAHLARELPDRRCLGSDRSPSMIDHAKLRHGCSSVDFFLSDACNIASTGIRCDVLIARFLNAEVMTRKQAQRTLQALIPCVKPGGTLLIFGHTPVLLAMPYLAQTLKLHLISSVAAREGQSELFEFYQLRVPA